MVHFTPVAPNWTPPLRSSPCWRDMQPCTALTDPTLAHWICSIINSFVPLLFSRFPQAYWSSVCLYLRNVLRAWGKKKKTTSYHVKTEAGLSENSFVFFPRTGFKDVICVWANQEKHVKGIEPETGRGAAGEARTAESLAIPANLKLIPSLPRSPAL